MYATPETYIPQSGSIRSQLAVWLIISLGAITLSSAIIAAPLALSSGHLIWALPIYHAFSLVCHQIPERSFFIAGHPFAVCARCFGLYAGFTLATIAYPLVSSLKKTDAPPRKWLFLAAVPLLIDYGLGAFGIWNNTHTSRFLTGALLGAVAVFYTMPGLLDLGLRLTGNKTKAAIAPLPDFPQVMPAGSRVAPSDYSSPHRRI
ncbi:MAG TPA: DUF2085 domain-containing protein [Pyrinomonadaceae bacterium]|nr:DUF2085 domain-containing protein [Pyrinomonadaceae bacterium]